MSGSKLKEIEDQVDKNLKHEAQSLYNARDKLSKVGVFLSDLGGKGNPTARFANKHKNRGKGWVEFIQMLESASKDLIYGGIYSKNLVNRVVALSQNFIKEEKSALDLLLGIDRELRKIKSEFIDPLKSIFEAFLQDAVHNKPEYSFNAGNYYITGAQKLVGFSSYSIIKRIDVLLDAIRKVMIIEMQIKRKYRLP